MSPLNKLTVGPRLEPRLAAYATLAGVALAAPAMTEAAIVYSGPVIINVPSSTSGIYLNVVTGLFGTTPGSVPGWDLNPWGSGSFFVWGNNAASPNDGIVDNFSTGSSSTLVDNLPVGTLVNSLLNFGRTDSIETTGATAFNLNSSINYIGFRFLNESTGIYDFGWLQFSLAGAFNGQPRTILGWAYDNTGASINVGTTGASGVPESGSTISLLAMVAAGALGVRAWRNARVA